MGEGEAIVRRYRVGHINVARVMALRKLSKKTASSSQPTDPKVIVFQYYRMLLRDSGIWTSPDTMGEEMFTLRLSRVALSFLFTTVLCLFILNRFLAAPILFGSFFTCLVLVPLIYWTLGGGWVRFCRYVTEATDSALHCSQYQKGGGKQWRKRHILFAGFLILQFLLVGANFGASIATEMIDESELASLVIGICCFISVCLVAFGTHGVGGKLRHACYRFYQPFEGGLLYCVLQGAAWILFSTSFLMIGAHSFCSFMCLIGRCSGCVLSTLSSRMQTPTPGDDLIGPDTMLVPATSAAVLAEILLVTSIFVYRQTRITPASKDRITRARTEPTSRGTETADLEFLSNGKWRHGIIIMFFTFILFKPEMVILASAYAALTLGAPHHAWVAVGWLVMSFIYSYTYAGKPGVTGRRGWKNFQRFSIWVFDKVFVPYFSMSVIRDTPEPFDESDKYIFGYHPHGIIPIACQWTSLTTEWDKKFPNLRPAVLVSTIVHSCPLMRDVAQWNGGHEVSREGFLTALNKRKAVLLVPGGQEEMIGSRSDSTKVPIVTKHRGFIRLALQQGAKLVPVYSFGETQTFDNVAAPHSWQRWCVKQFRANLICFPYGVLPMLPRPTRLTIAVGKPIPVPKIENPTDEQIAVYHHRYFNALSELFMKYRKEAGRGDDVLVFNPPMPPTEKVPRSSSAPVEARRRPSSEDSKQARSTRRHRRKNKAPKLPETFFVGIVTALLFMCAVVMKRSGL
mmetsp:Transcript_37/g.82  ORF Transcript_37/g.82 Transcript_37/m.82 type:complete len:740 (-) Transcript_37:206-2425(-)